MADALTSAEESSGASRQDRLAMQAADHQTSNAADSAAENITAAQATTTANSSTDSSVPSDQGLSFTHHHDAIEAALLAEENVRTNNLQSTNLLNSSLPIGHPLHSSTPLHPSSGGSPASVSYTHLTLPTILLV